MTNLYRHGLAVSLFMLGTVFSSGVSAEELEDSAKLADLALACTYIKTTLDIRLSYPEGSKIPCSVSYQRNQQQALTLWQTDAEEGFCESRLKMLVDKLVDEDWSCKEVYIEESKIRENKTG